MIHHYGVFMPEKKTAHFRLRDIKSLFSRASSLVATRTAIRGAAERGFGSDEIVAILQTMEEGHFYK